MRAQQGLGRDRSERERDALLKLARVFAQEARGGHLGEALEVVLDASRLEGGAAFSADGASLNLVAERGLQAKTNDRESSNDLVKEALIAAAARATAGRKLLHLPDLARADLDSTLRSALTSRGFRSLVALPVHHQREVLGILVVLAQDTMAIDAEALSFYETAAHLVALAAERDRRVERELAYRAELIEAGQMAALGLLTATVAHELRGPVGALGIQLAEQRDLLARLTDVATDSIRPMLNDMDELARDMAAASGQMGTLIAQLSSLSRREAATDRVELGAIAREGLAIARGELKRRGISLIEIYGPPCFTMGRRDNLIQVILNLVFNAADACVLANRTHPQITVRTRLEPSRVIVSVDDTGPGVANSDVHAIFQPFFTTKVRGQGTGLGLKICSDVISAHHGHIEVKNLEEGGASFRVILPRHQSSSISGDSREKPASTPASAPLEVREVFVVDDDVLFARTLKRALKPHHVRTSSSASEAEMALLDPDYAPHIVLCDLSLPGVTGHVLHGRIHAQRPDIAERFVFVTGGACSQAEADYLRASGCRTLLKPVDIKDIWTVLALENPRLSQIPEGVATLRSELPLPNRDSDAPTLPPD